MTSNRQSVIKAVWSGGSVSCHRWDSDLDCFMDWFKSMKLIYVYKSTISRDLNFVYGWCLWLYRAKKKDQHRVGTGDCY